MLNVLSITNLTDIRKKSLLSFGVFLNLVLVFQVMSFSSCQTDEKKPKEYVDFGAEAWDEEESDETTRGSSGTKSNSEVGFLKSPRLGNNSGSQSIRAELSAELEKSVWAIRVPIGLSDLEGNSAFNPGSSSSKTAFLQNGELVKLESLELDKSYCQILLERSDSILNSSLAGDSEALNPLPSSLEPVEYPLIPDLVSLDSTSSDELKLIFSLSSAESPTLKLTFLCSHLRLRSELEMTFGSLIHFHVE